MADQKPVLTKEELDSYRNWCMRKRQEGPSTYTVDMGIRLLDLVDGLGKLAEERLTVLEAWFSVFGSSQLTHAKDNYDSAKREAEKANGNLKLALDALQACNEALPLRDSLPKTTTRIGEICRMVDAVFAANGVKPAKEGKTPIIWTKSRKAVMAYLFHRGPGVWTSPSDIGGQVGGGVRHSSWASPILKSLQEHGYVERNKRGHWAITQAGKDVLMAGTKEEFK